MAVPTSPTGFEIACELADLGAGMVAARIRRDRPDATDAEIDEAVRAWWADRPGAPDGDAAGIVRRPT